MHHLDGIYDGVLTLTRDDGEPLDVALLIAISDGAVTYTVQTIDRAHSETIRSAPGEPCAFFDRAMVTIMRVARTGRDPALRQT